MKLKIKCTFLVPSKENHPEDKPDQTNKQNPTLFPFPKC